MPNRKEPELTPTEQKKRFGAPAPAVGARLSPEEFQKALRITLKAKKVQTPK